MSKSGYVYILSSTPNGTLYVGVTSDLVRRVHEHREGLVPGFTKRNGVKTLVHYEVFDDIASAIAREKAIKKWRRAWKLRLISESNPDWRDLWAEIAGPPPARG
ncbi:MAG: GIY-YIG nuclease family protein [Rhodospirillales bacterium]